MLSRRLIYALSNKINTGLKSRFYKMDNPSEDKLIVDFNKTKKSPFDIKSESSYNAYLSNGSLLLGLKKTNCIAWVDIPDYEYQDHVIEAKFRLDSLGGYAAAGVIFRIMDEDSYYLALVSSKGYFRLDVVKDSSPKTLIAWTEIPDFDGINASLSIITYGTFIISLVNDKWLGEVSDNTVRYGCLGFALASYSENDEQGEEQATENKSDEKIVCKAYLDYLSVDSRVKSIEDNFNKWTDDLNINANSRLRLAETFAVMDEPVKALDQINRAWKRRDEAIKSATATYSEVRTRKELLLAARMSFQLGQYNEANEYVDLILEQDQDSIEGKLACSNKIKILHELNKFSELKEFAKKHHQKIEKDIDFFTLIAHCYWQLNEYKNSAEAWSKAYKINKDKGVYAVNAANAYELAENKNEALAYYIEAGKIFLNQDNNPELAAMMPKLALLGEKNWEARALVGKWAFSIEDYEKSAQEFDAADKLRRSLKPQPKADPALFYLWGLVYYINGKNQQAINLLEKAVKRETNYKLFRLKLDENKKRLT
jgi:tetratricopeptide (TPR) repeat protein